MYGINDTAFTLSTESFADTLDHYIQILASNVMIGKLIPVGTEGTMMALAGSLIILSQFIVKNLMGVLINMYFLHVIKENMTNYPEIEMVQLIGCVIPFFYINLLVPKHKEI